MAEEESLRELSREERQLKNSLKAIVKFANEFQRSTQENQIEVRLEALENVMQKFYSVRRKIEIAMDEVDPEEDDEDVKETAEERKKRLEKAIATREAQYDEAIHVVEEKYCEVKAALISLRPPKPSSSQSTAGVQVPVNSGISRVKLPDIKLPSFSGKIKEWITFRDTFRSLIHNNRQLAPIDKFTYLRSSVHGDALQEICSVELSAENYEVAWKALEKKFENKKLIVKAHLDAIFSVEPLRRENCDALTHLINEFDRNLQMLNKIGENTANWSTILAYMLCSRLDSATLRLWESHHNSKDVPEFDELLEFLRDHCLVLQSIAPCKPIESEQKRARVTTTHTSSESARKCLFCAEPFHLPFKCNKFKGLTINQRVEEANKKRLCRNCLSAGHYAEGCSKGSCTKCGRKHHTMLHFENAPTSPRAPKPSVPQTQDQTRAAGQTQPQPSQTPPNGQTQTPTQPATQTTNSYPVIQSSSQHTPPQPTTDPHATVTLKAVKQSENMQSLPRQVLMSTAIVRVQDPFGNVSFARTLLDSCSEFCYVTTSFSKKLKLKETPALLKVEGIGSGSVTSTKSVKARIQPRQATLSAFDEDMQFYVLPKITRTLPISPVQVKVLEIPSDIVLADPTFGEPGPIDMIIGAEFYIDLLAAGRRKLSDCGPTLQETVFGWIVSGRVPEVPANIPRTMVDLQELIAKFWELETCHINSTSSVEETACEEIFNRTTTRNGEGKFIVALPRKEHVMEKLGESKNIAIKRFLSLERRLDSDQELKAMYTEFIHEYQLMGHMKQVPEETDSEAPVYYLPHHAVLRPDSTTTKLRVVFDASCRTSTGVSLNDALMVGPVDQDPLLAILLRFRLHRIAVVSDVAKMYRMVLTQPTDHPLHKIVWRDSKDQPLKFFELTTVTYGTASAPYLATRCLKKLGEDCAATHPVASEVIQHDFYVDDMLSGADSIEEAKTLVKQVKDVSDSAGFSLRKWNSNSSEVLRSIPKLLRDDRSILELDSSNATVKTLGLRWNVSSDEFHFSFPQWKSNSSTITKRSIHSDAACLFDPLGLVGPVVVQAKIFIQQLWRLKCGWDDPLDESIQEMWREYRQNLMALETLTIPRWVGLSNDCVSVQLHEFSDASTVAYGACLYLRCVASDGSVTVRLITSKSRVAPLENLEQKKKKMTIPRLELSAALLLSHLYEKFVQVKAVPTAFFWTDSTIVNHWLGSPPSRWQVFVANRVSEIQHLTQGGTWSHVAGIENPADLISRGMSPAQLQYERRWFEGPQWLLQDQCYWPQTSQISEVPEDVTLLEERTSQAFSTQGVPPNELFGLRWSYQELQRIVALLIRFKHNTTNRSSKRTGPVSLEELEEALIVLVRQAQQDSFPEEMADLGKQGEVKSSSRIKSLYPILKAGIICVGGRLANAPVPETRKHPFILDHRHPLAIALARHYHYKFYHAGQQLLLATLRERFWPTNANSLARKVIHGCIPCFRRKPKVIDQLMADLPVERVTPSAPFLKVGVNYCGPFHISYPNRKSSPVKCYVAVFVCLSVKAIHLELVVDLTTQAFIAALRRFVARRARPQLIMCDNATTFVGANRELKELCKQMSDRKFQDPVVKEAANDGIEFKFIPPRTPNFGGLWEAQVKSFKTHFKKAVGLRTLKNDEMLTALAQIEAVLNSRPMTAISSDRTDYEALTPGHFLVQRPLTAVADRTFDDVSRPFRSAESC